MRGFSYDCGGERYVTDASQVYKVTRGLCVTPVPASPPCVIGIAGLKGKVITILDLGVLLKRRPPAPVSANEMTYAVIFRTAGHNDDQMGLRIDKPGALCDIAESGVRPPPVTQAEVDILSGIAEINGVLHRIVDSDAIKKKFMHTTESGYTYGEAIS